MKWNSSALRKGRFSEVGRIYLVTFATHNRQPILQHWSVVREIVKVMRAESSVTETLAYVVMPDHVHWLIQLDHKSLSETVQTLKSITSRRIKRITGLAGPVWQAGFHDHALRKDEELINVARYVVLNPVRAGLVTRVGGYPYWDAKWL